MVRKRGQPCRRNVCEEEVGGHGGHREDGGGDGGERASSPEIYGSSCLERSVVEQKPEFCQGAVEIAG